LRRGRKGIEPVAVGSLLAARSRWLACGFSALIQIKANGGGGFSVSRAKPGICHADRNRPHYCRDRSVFAVFAVALAWASYYTRNFRAPGAEY
jgi:hypothetical protein